MLRFELRAIPHQDTAVVRMTIAQDQIAQAMARALPAAFEAVVRTGQHPAGPPFARYFTFGPVIDLEAGVPVSAPFADDGEVRGGELGGCEAAVGLHVGPYESLGETYAAMETWIREQGREPAGPLWEIYLTDPEQEPDPST